jgi:hypothetical protein
VIWRYKSIGKCRTPIGWITVTLGNVCVTYYKQNISTIDNIINNNMLINQIKPEILARLDENYEQYNASVNSVYDKLSTSLVYGDLSVSDVRTIITFADLSTTDWNYVDFLHGTKLLNNEYNHKYGR